VFQYDRVFSPFSTQNDIFEEVKEVADLCLEGEKVAVIAMGAPQTGKSFTLLGERKQHGVIPRCIQYVSVIVTSSFGCLLLLVSSV
jgi:hypothetical protein